MPKAQAFFVSTQANFAAACIPCVREKHLDSAPLTILARLLSQQYLHPVLREQGGPMVEAQHMIRRPDYSGSIRSEILSLIDTRCISVRWELVPDDHPVTSHEVEEAVL